MQGTGASFRLFSASGETGTSIVDICQMKIQDALKADSVKVTGKLTPQRHSFPRFIFLHCFMAIQVLTTILTAPISP